MREFEIYVDEDKISKHLFNELIYLGYAPTEDECDDIAAILFDYLLNLSLIDEIEGQE